MMKSILTTIAFLALAVSGLAQTRSVIVNTSGVVQSPTNFWSANATNARSGLGLGTAATNPATAFQPSSSVLTNLANNNGSTLTNISAAGVVGILATNGNGAGLTNLTAANITGAIAISNGGSGATTAGGARTNLGLGATNDVEFQTVKINLSTGAGDSLIVTNSGSSATSIFDDITVNELDAETAAFGNTVIVSSNGISFNTNTAAETRTNLGLGATWLTNTDASNFRTAIGLGASKLSPTLTNITGLTSVTLESGRALEVSILSASGWGTSNIITLPTNSPQHNDIVTIFFQRSPSTAPAIVENAGGLGGPWYIYSGNEAKWIYDTNSAPARWQPLGKTVRAEINYLGDDASSTRVNLGLGEANSVTFSSLTLSSNLTLGSGDNIVLSTTTGTKIGTATNQLLGFYNQTPITQPSSTGVTTNGFTAGGGTGVHPNSTFTGGIGTNAYTISDVVAHLKSLGLLAP